MRQLRDADAVGRTQPHRQIVSVDSQPRELLVLVAHGYVPRRREATHRAVDGVRADDGEGRRRGEDALIFQLAPEVGEGNLSHVAEPLGDAELARQRGKLLLEDA